MFSETKCNKLTIIDKRKRRFVDIPGNKHVSIVNDARTSTIDTIVSIRSHRCAAMSRPIDTRLAAVDALLQQPPVAVRRRSASMTQVPTGSQPFYTVSQTRRHFSCPYRNFARY